jgi:hypothetical protein
MLIYCDSCILIYYYDHAGSINLRATNRLADLHAGGDQIAVSDLVRLECRVRPIKIHDHAKLAAFDFFLRTGRCSSAANLQGGIRSGDLNSSDAQFQVRRFVAPCRSYRVWLRSLLDQRHAFIGDKCYSH